MHGPTATKVIDNKYNIDFAAKTKEFFLQCTGWLMVNVSCMSLKLLRTQPHIVENLGITMVPLF